MNKQEKQFQNYFMKIAKPLNYYRTSLTNGTGFPDVIGFHGEMHSLVELKDLILGKRGDRKLGQCFEDSQPPWYIEYLRGGGTRLFIAFRIRDWDGSNKRYGLWKLTRKSVMDIHEMYYSDLVKSYSYTEYTKCNKMIQEIQYVSGAN